MQTCWARFALSLAELLHLKHSNGFLPPPESGRSPRREGVACRMTSLDRMDGDPSSDRCMQRSDPPLSGEGKPLHLLGLALLAAALISGFGAANAASADAGRGLYLKYGCWQCHGTQGQGGVAGPRIAPDPMPSDAFSAFVRTTKGQMPPYSAEVLPDADLADIYAYLQSIPKPPDPKSIPLLSQ